MANFSWRSAFDGSQELYSNYHNIDVIAFGAYIMLALIFAIVKSTELDLYTHYKPFCVFLKGTPILVQLDVDLLWNSTSFESLESTMGNFSEH